jgi:hypothetical protein
MQCVADPSPFPFLDLLLNGDLPSSLPEVLVGNHLCQSDVEEAFVDDSLVSDDFFLNKHMCTCTCKYLAAF